MRSWRLCSWTRHPCPASKFAPPGVPLAGRKSLKLTLGRFKEELGGASFKLYECVETEELSNPAEDLASFMERQALAIAAGSRHAGRGRASENSGCTQEGVRRPREA